MALAWVDSNLQNGDFESGDLASWTVVEGTPYVKASTFAEGSYYLVGGATSGLDILKQSITLPVDARACELYGMLGCDATTGWDIAGVALKFFDGGATYIGGLWITADHEASGSYRDEHTARGLVPASAVTAEVWIYLARYTGTVNNALVDDLTVRWLAGPNELEVSSNQVVNGGFETGDLTGWEHMAGEAMEVSSVAGIYLHSGSWALIGGDIASARYRQAIVVPGNAVGFYCSAWLTCALAEPDSLSFRVISRSVIAGVIETLEVSSPLSHINQVQASFYSDIAPGTVYIEIEIVATRVAGVILNAGIDDVELYWITDDTVVGRVSGTMKVEGIAAVRDLIAITYDKQPVLIGDTYVNSRVVVGETQSDEAGDYEIDMLGFTGEVIVLALENYGQAWQPDTDYVIGDRIRPTVASGFAYDITVGGNSGPTEPSWWEEAAGAVGSATAQAVKVWWSVAHAPIVPDAVEA